MVAPWVCNDLIMSGVTDSVACRKCVSLALMNCLNLPSKDLMRIKKGGGFVIIQAARSPSTTADDNGSTSEAALVSGVAAAIVDAVIKC